MIEIIYDIGTKKNLLPSFASSMPIRRYLAALFSIEIADIAIRSKME